MEHFSFQTRSTSRPMKALLNGHLSDARSNIVNDSVNSSSPYPFGLKSDLPEHQFNNTPQKASIFDVNVADEDILTMAAQRDQLRGGIRNVRGMMAPIISKEVSDYYISLIVRIYFYNLWFHIFHKKL